jgi:hypothetical protein
VPRRERNQMREALERDDVAVVNRLSKRIVKSTELSQIMLLSASAAHLPTAASLCSTLTARGRKRDPGCGIRDPQLSLGSRGSMVHTVRRASRDRLR